ncbi:xanthine dehydrogenase accessory protein XdhC [Endomicrobium sp. AH-315-J14]|nr:xanthine dehydrogenase accessory protein XdhC [Endomicrobium sp. AH-315-J14]
MVVLREALARVDAGQRVVVATVVERKGSTPSTPGQKLALLSETEAVGTIGGGAIEHRVLQAMREVLATDDMQPHSRSFDLGPSIGMCCGGSVEVLIEPLAGALSVLIVGAGHIGTALAPLLEAVGFDVVLCDGREDAVDPERIGSLLRAQLLEADHDDPEVVQALATPCPRAACVIMTHDHQLDQKAIEWALGQGFAFVGGVGSRAKAVRTRNRLTAKDFSVKDIDRVEMPLGVDIAARSPAEIAVSICGGLIEWRASRLGTHRARRRETASSNEGSAAE